MESQIALRRNQNLHKNRRIVRSRTSFAVIRVIHPCNQCHPWLKTRSVQSRYKKEAGNQSRPHSRVSQVRATRGRGPRALERLRTIYLTNRKNRLFGLMVTRLPLTTPGRFAQVAPPGSWPVASTW